MKKAISVLIAFILVFSLTACSGPGNSNEKEPVSSVVIPEKPSSPNNKVIKTKLWSLSYDPGIWQFDESTDLTANDSCPSIVMVIPDGKDSYIANVEIRASLEEPYYFRNMLVNYGYDQYQYAEKKAYETVSLGGVDCLVNKGEYWGDPALRYLSRVEGAGATVFVEIIGDYDDPRVEELLSGLTFDLTDNGSKDGPWYWQGEPFSGSTHTAKVGSHTLTAQWLPFSEAIIADNVFAHTAAVLKDKVYLFGGGTLKQYAYDGAALKYENNIPLSGNYEAIQGTDDGTLWLSGPKEPLAAFENGKMRSNYEGPSMVSMHPSGEWGVSWFYLPNGQIITPHGDTMDTAPIRFKAVSGISGLMTDENYIFVCGDVTDGTGHKICVYTPDGVLWHMLDKDADDGLVNVCFAKETENGFIGLDSYLGEIVLWDKDADYIGTVSGSELFGTDNPRFCHAAPMDDGSLLVIMTADRADRSAAELVAFKLSGF